MRVLVVGAGTLGGTFGGSLIELGRDVTVRARPKRAEQIARRRLAIRRPPHGTHVPFWNSIGKSAEASDAPPST